MILYASNTGTRRNLQEFRRHGWRVLLTPRDPKWPEGLSAAIDNGAWTNHRQGLPFDSEGFLRLVGKHGATADWVVIPDVIGDGAASMELSEWWVRQLTGLRLLFVLQDGMTIRQVQEFLERHPDVGLFLGGSTEWKLKTIYTWGMLAQEMTRYYHVGRVNSARRIRLAAEAGAHSIDGSSGSRYALTVPGLDAAAKQPSLLTPHQIGGEGVSHRKAV